MERWIRWLVALGVFFVVFMGSFAVAGSKAAEESPEDSPAWFQTEPSRVGDKGLYKTALVVVKDGRGEYIDMEARYAFERLPDELMLGPEGVVATESFVAEWRTEYYDMVLREVLDLPTLPPDLQMPDLDLPNCFPDPPGPNASDEDWDDYEDAMEDCEDEREDALDDYHDGVEEATEAYQEDLEAWIGMLDQQKHIVVASDWHVTHLADNQTVATTFDEKAEQIAQIRFKPLPTREPNVTAVPLPSLTLTKPLPVPGPCGWRTSLQSGPQDMWQPITVHGECPPNMDLGFAQVRHIDGPITMAVSGEDEVGGEPAVVFSIPGKEDALRLWFQADTPYPVRVLTQTTSVPEAIRQELGSGYDAPAFYVLHELVHFEAGIDTNPLVAPAVASGTDDAAWGPTMEHPWPLATAVAQTRGDPVDCEAWAGWLEDHPEARAVEADYHVLVTDDPDHADPIIDETWSVTAADGATVEVLLHRHTETTADLLTGPVRMPDVWCSPVTTTQGTAAGPRLAIDAAMDRAQALGMEPSDYAFHDDILRLEQGPLSPDGGAILERLQLAPDGGLIEWGRSETPYPDPTFGDPEWQPSAEDDWAIHPASKGAWAMPHPATAASLTGAAVAAGALVLVIPAIKGLLGALPMFSRIKKEDLLEHPVRGEIVELIEADPGIHFQELVRRIGKGRGTMEHHIRKLVAGGVLVERAEKGFSCYFAKGRVDRHLMAAAPLLKAEGGRKVLGAVCGTPGTVAQQIAEHLGMSTSTVNYHVKRLAAAGLIDPQRNGRFVTLTSTALGDEALGRFGQT